MATAVTVCKMDEHSVEEHGTAGMNNGIVPTMSENGIVNPAIKRPIAPCDNSDTPSKMPKMDALLMYSDKNPVSVLNELRLSLKYNVVQQKGPSHAPVFTVAVSVDGHTFLGIGGSKKVAKYNAAAQALQSFIQFPSSKLNVNFQKPSSMDFTEDTIPDELQPQKRGRSKVNNTHTNNNTGNNTTKPVKKNPLMLINELYPNAVYECNQNSNNDTDRYKAVLTVEEQVFCGVGSSKKAAKNSAALMALPKLTKAADNNLINECFDQVNPWSEDQIMADHIGKLVQNKFASLMEDDATHARRKVLAGIVMTRDSKLETAEVICVTTGTKCITGGFLSMDGSTLNDMHAEILARRCLILYYYKQLKLHTAESTSASSIFELRRDGNGFRLKDGIDFHLYINTAPCGDARIFSPQEEENIDKHPNRQSRGKLRTKIEGGEGTVLVPIQEQQTWDGILQGERLLNMSCSDKICRWNVVGIQGGLLANFIEPIYLKSIVLGSLFKVSHLHRALYGRIESTIGELIIPEPYRLHKPNTYRLIESESRVPGKASCFAVLWSVCNEDKEICNTEKGSCTDLIPSSVCKQKLLMHFCNLCGEIPSITKIESKLPTVYSDMKEFSSSYAMANKCVKEAFFKAKLGKWVSKPLEERSFSCF